MLTLILFATSANEWIRLLAFLIYTNEYSLRLINTSWFLHCFNNNISDNNLMIILFDTRKD